MAEITEHRHTVECSERVHSYTWRDDPHAGFSFHVDADGEIIRKPGNAENVDHLAEWVASGVLIDDGIEVREWSYTVPATLLCDCGMKVYLEGFTNTCDNCERDYNSSGQMLAPRSQWGEETGESLSDILRIP